MAAAAGAEPYEEMLRVVEACAARIRWRLRPASKRRLLNDILFLCTGLRPVVLVDYGGTMPQLQENLCSLLRHARQETSILNPLRVMIIGDMVYLIHVKGLAEHASPNARSQQQLTFVDLEKRCCSLLTTIEENDIVLELLSIQDQFAAKFPIDLSVVRSGIAKEMSGIPQSAIDVECTNNHVEDRNLLVDLSTFLENKQIVLPSLNGWLLGYPLTYLFCNGSAEAAIQNISRQSLHIYRVYVCRSYWSVGKQSEEELLSFSVPCCLSTKRDEEVWAKSFIARMNEKLRRCNQVWASIRLEVEVFQSQSQTSVQRRISSTGHDHEHKLLQLSPIGDGNHTGSSYLQQSVTHGTSASTNEPSVKLGGKQKRQEDTVPGRKTGPGRKKKPSSKAFGPEWIN